MPQIAARVDDRLRLLVGGSRDAGPRHTSLRAALDWSYRLLDERGRLALRRLSVFAGGCRLEAAEDVLPGGDLRRSDVAAVLADLDERNLVTVSARGREPRFVLLESVHDYAAEQLAADHDDQEATRARQLAWCLGHVRAHDVQGDREADELALVFAEWPNLLRALELAVNTDRAGDGLRLAIALDDAWMFRGMHQQARVHYAALVDAAGVTDAERARALSNFAYATTLASASTEAMQLLDRAAEHAARAGDRELHMRVLFHRGIALIEDGRPAAALEPLRYGREIAGDLARPRSIGAFDDAIATALLYSGRAADAAELYRRANDGDRRAGHTHGLVRGLVNEASALVSVGDIDGALRCADEGIDQARALGDGVAEASLRAVHGFAAMSRRDPTSAVRHFREALTHLAADEVDAHLCRLDLADALLQAGELVEARRTVDGITAALAHRGVVWLLAQPTLAELAAAEGDTVAAARILQYAEQEYAERGFAWPLALRRMERGRSALAAPLR